MSTLIIHHHVRNYDAWRPAYDRHESVRKSAGLTNERVFGAIDDLNDLVILLDITDKDRA
jgi:hypothetical protein